MTTESVVNVEEMEEVDMLSLLAKSQERELGDDDDAEEDEGGDDIASLKKVISEQKRIIKNAQKANKRLIHEQESMMERISKLESAPRHNESGNVDQAQLEREAQEWIDRVSDDPVNAIKYADYKQSKLEEKLANYLGSQFQRFEQMIGEISGKADPERMKYENELTILKQRPEFQDMADAQLIPFAKLLKGTTIKQPRGVVGGKRAPSHTEKKFELTDDIRAAMGF